MDKDIVHFLRKKDYVLERELGQGACGKTVLLRDEQLDSHFVCKKYAPSSDLHRQELYQNFIREIKLLHRIHHPNVVRVFNYYLYPDLLAGYILMEYIEGTDVEQYLQANPEQTNDVFHQAVEGFRYLQANQILHRDIRPRNVLVSAEGVVKIIDLGFGKHIQKSDDFDKSITLNWWCEPPAEFVGSIYNFTSEVYFVGKMFEKIIQANGIEHFKHQTILTRMCARAAESRIPSFSDVHRLIQSGRFFEIEFEDDELQFYREFAYMINASITKIELGTKYVEDLERVRAQLEIAYRKCMLEEYVPDAATVLRCLLNGAYYYKKSGIPVGTLKNFVYFLKASSLEKQRIALANLHTRFDAIARYVDEPDDDIPF